MTRVGFRSNRAVQSQPAGADFDDSAPTLDIPTVAGGGVQCANAIIISSNWVVDATRSSDIAGGIQRIKTASGKRAEVISARGTEHHIGQGCGIHCVSSVSVDGIGIIKPKPSQVVRGDIPSSKGNGSAISTVITIPIHIVAAQLQGQGAGAGQIATPCAAVADFNISPYRRRHIYPLAVGNVGLHVKGPAIQGYDALAAPPIH